jgi:transposase
LNRSGHLGQHASVCAELECHHNSRYDPQAECHTEYLEPKLKEDAICRAAGREMQRLENGEPGGQSDTESRKDTNAASPRRQTACSRRKGGNQNHEALGRSRGGFSTKIHLRTNAKGDPLTFDVTGGEAHEVKGYEALMRLHEANPSKLLGDKGYDSDDIRRDLIDRGIEPVIPPRSNRKTPIKYDREAYKRRNLIERCVNRLKQFRRIATRYQKTARAFVSMLCIAAARLWIKTVNTA